MCATQVRMGTGSCLLEYFMLSVIWPGSFEEPICLSQSNSFVLEVSSWSDSSAFKKWAQLLLRLLDIEQFAVYLSTFICDKIWQELR